MSKKLSRKEELVLESYRAYFPDIDKACEMSKFDIDEFIYLAKTNDIFKYRVEKIRLGFFSLAENTLVSIIKSKDSTDNNKIMASKALLQYKKEIQGF
jgi:hypothetical protein